LGTSGTVVKRRSALVRPLDRRYPTNLAVMILAPVAGAAFAGANLWHGHELTRSLEAALRGGLIVFTTWALAREIAPDDNPGAFVAMALGLLVGIHVPSSSAMLVLTTQMLARLLTRSVGVAPTWFDSTAAVILAGWTAYSLDNGAVALVAGIAFALDAGLNPPLRQQWIFALLCLVGGLGLFLRHPGEPLFVHQGWITLCLGAIAAIYILVLVRTRQVRSIADVTGEPLSPLRVQAAMAVAWLVAALGAIGGTTMLAQSALIWAVLAGLILTWLLRLVTQPGTFHP
jgi:hypothetical protein